MINIETLQQNKIALYGLSTETERFIKSYGDKLSIIGLLDGFRERGEMYGYPIKSLDEAAQSGVETIIVIARPGSCKAITKRIGEFCKINNITIIDVRGKDLLTSVNVSYEFRAIHGMSKQALYERIENADVISFDLFDTLVMRKIPCYTDVFVLMDIRLKEQGIFIPDFAKLRLHVEKELSRVAAPRLISIYERLLEIIGGSFIDASGLTALEWEIDFSLMTPRTEVRDVYQTVVSRGKKVIITTDSYYSKEQIEQILSRFEIAGFDNLFVSCDSRTSKAQDLFDVVKNTYKGHSILHIGDDEYADMEKAGSHGIKAFRIYSALDLLENLGGQGIEETNSISDRVKVGLFLSRIFNSPFWFEEDGKKLSVDDASDIGYLFCAPLITDFVHWMKECTSTQGYDQIIYGARDGYLIGRLYRLIEKEQTSYYFLTSRTAAIRAGVETKSDIDYVENMKFSGTREEAIKTRYGIEIEDFAGTDITALILDKAKKLRENYKRYMDKLSIEDKPIAFFDFVAKGTTQMFLTRLFESHMRGFYFLQLEPEFMDDKGLDIEPFYSESERDTSAIFDNYYILETILTSPYPQMLEMDEDGRPVFAPETRSDNDIKVFQYAQNGIEEYFTDYINIVPPSARTSNKNLDEKFLELVNKVEILDDNFLKIQIEDSFFGRMTDIKEVIG